jgi:DinB superfamily
MNDELVERVRAARSGLEGTRAAIEARAPWPLAAVFDHSDEADWGPAEVLAHLAEMVPFWLGEMERVVAGSPGPTPFGRLATNPLRIGILERDRTLPPSALYDRISNDLGLFERRVGTLSTSDLASRGLHPTRGEMTVEEMPDIFVVRHLTEHVTQIGSMLADPPTDD